MPKRKKNAKNRKPDPAQYEIQTILGRMIGYSDDYVIAVSEVVTYSRDGSSRAALEQIRKALDHAEDVKKLIKLLPIGGASC
jgi:hypothetical protein